MFMLLIVFHETLVIETVGLPYIHINITDQYEYLSVECLTVPYVILVVALPDSEDFVLLVHGEALDSGDLAVSLLHGIPEVVRDSLTTGHLRLALS